MSFVEKLEQWLGADFQNSTTEGENDQFKSIDFRIRQLCLEIIHKNTKNADSVNRLSEFQKTLYSQTNKIYSTVYISIYMLVKFDAELNRTFNLTTTAPFSSDHKSYFVYRCMAYDDADFINSGSSDSSDHGVRKFRSHVVQWLGLVFDELFQLSMSKQTFVQEKLTANLNLRLVIKQIDSLTRFKTQTARDTASIETTKPSKTKVNSFIKKMLKNSWTYLIDVLIGFVLNTNLACIENLLFANSTRYLDLINNTEFSLTIFALKSCLASLEQIIRIVTSLPSMNKELNQMLFLLIESNYFQSNSNNTTLSLNKIICIDFVLFSTSQLLLLQQSENCHSQDLLWKYLIEAIFFCFNLQASSFATLANSNEDSSPGMVDTYSKRIGRIFAINSDALSNRTALFKSIHFNIQTESITLNRTNSCPTGENNNESSGSNLDSVDQEEKMVDAEKERDFARLKYELIFQNLFKFLNKIDRKEYRTKFDLIDQLSNCVDQCLFNNFLDELNSNELSSNERFDFIWKFCVSICLFSRKCLLEDLNLRNRNEYFTFNTLIVDKIEEILIRLVNKACMIQQPFVFTEIWLNVFIVYFQKIFEHSTAGSPSDLKSRRKRRKQLKKQNKRASLFNFKMLFLVI